MAHRNNMLFAWFGVEAVDGGDDDDADAEAIDSEIENVDGIFTCH